MTASVFALTGTLVLEALFIYLAAWRGYRLGLTRSGCEREQMRQTLREILEELRLGDSRHDLQAKIISTPGFSEQRSGES